MTNVTTMTAGLRNGPRRCWEEWTSDVSSRDDVDAQIRSAVYQHDGGDTGRLNAPSARWIHFERTLPGWLGGSVLFLEWPVTSALHSLTQPQLADTEATEIKHLADSCKGRRFTSSFQGRHLRVGLTFKQRF